MMKRSFRQEIYRSSRTIFNIKDIGILTGEKNADRLKAKVNYYTARDVLKGVRKGIYVKEGYAPEELACRIYTPSYISLESVLQQAGVIFQFSSVITAVSYLSRSLTVDGNEIAYRKIKNSILINNTGITQKGNINIATPERAFLDQLYLSKVYYFDNIGALDWNKVETMLSLYACATLEARARKLFNHD